MKHPVRHLCLGLVFIFLIFWGYRRYTQDHPVGGGQVGVSATAREHAQARAFPRGGSKPELLLQTGHHPYPACAALSPDGRYVLACASYSGWEQIKLWNVASGRQIAEFKRPGLKRILEYTPDGRHFLVACGVSAELWDMASGHAIVTFPIQGEFGTNRSLGLCTVSPTGKYTLLSGGRENPRAVYLCETETGRVLHILRRHGHGICTCAFSQDEKKLTTAAHWYDNGEAQNELMIWDLAKGEHLRSIDLDKQPGYTRLAFHPDNRHLLVSKENTAVLYDTQTGTAGPILQLDEKQSIYGATFNSDGKYLILAHLDSYYDEDGHATLWDTQSGRKIRDLAEAGTSLWPPFHCPHFSADGKYLAIPDLRYGHPKIRILHWKQQRFFHTLDLQPFVVAHITQAQCRADNTLVLAYKEKDRKIAQYSGKPDRVATFTLNPLRLESLRTPPEQKASSARAALLEQVKKEGKTDEPIISPDGKLMVVVIPSGYTFMGGDKLVFFDSVREQIIKQYQLRDLDIRSLKFSSDSQYLLGACAPPTTILWDAGTGVEIRRYVDQAEAFKLNPDWSHDYSQIAVFLAQESQVLTNEAGDGGIMHTAIFDTATGRRERILQTLIGRDPIMSPHGDLMAFERKILDRESGKLLGTLPDRYWAMNFSADGKRLLAIDNIGPDSIGVFEVETARKLASIFILDDSQWIIVTPEGYFEGTENARRAVSWRIGGEVFPLELYQNRFHRPDLVSRALRGERLEQVEAISGAHKPPTLALAIGKTEAEYVILKATASPGSRAAHIQDVRIFVDGRDLTTVQESHITRGTASDRRMIFTAKVDFPPGKTRAVAAATVTDDFGLKSQPAVITIIRPGPATSVERRLFVLAVGVSDYGEPDSDLRYPHADAEALVSLFEKQKGLAYDDVQSRLLTNNNATAGNILQDLEWLKTNCKRADSVVIQFSGHGTRDRRGRLYYVPYGADVTDVAGTFVRWDTLAGNLREVKASSILFLSDCCHAGAFGQGPASQSDLAAPLLHEARVMVFSSSKGMELSLEMGSLKHGAFSYAVLNGLNGAADLIRDRRITISELQTYVANRVKVLTNDRQHPHIPLMQDFDPEMVIAYVK